MLKQTEPPQILKNQQLLLIHKVQDKILVLKDTYEISKKPVTTEVNSNTIIYAIAIVLILGIIAGYGYLKSKK